MGRNVLIFVFGLVFTYSLFGQTDTTVVLVSETPPKWLVCNDASISDVESCNSEQWRNFLEENLRYPSTCVECVGKVWLEFIIEKDGTISNIKILRSVCAPLDEEVVNIVKKLPVFIPATSNGVAVRYRYRIPINFTIH